MKQKKPVRKKILVIAACVLFAVLAGSAILSEVQYAKHFGSRFDTIQPINQRVEFFEGLERTKYTFPSNKGQMLTGYLYSSAGVEPKGIIILSHGYGSGHNNNMGCADYFTKHGYYVFGFDVTGNDESEGKAVEGLPQGVIDLEHAIEFVENSGNFPKLPIGLFGHSWGGYCVGAALVHHPEMKAVIDCSGFNNSTDLFISEGRHIAGPAVYLSLPFLKLHDWIKFGSYAWLTADEGFSKSDAKILVVHSSDDDIVPPEFGYDVYYRNHKDDPRFSFMRLEGKGHKYFYKDTKESQEIIQSYQNWVNSLDYDYKDPKNLERFIKERDEGIKENVDVKALWQNRLDEELFGKFVEFYDEAMSNKNEELRRKQLPVEAVFLIEGGLWPWSK